MIHGIGDDICCPPMTSFPKKLTLPFRPVTMLCLLIPSCARRFVTIPVAELTMVAAFGRFRRADTSGFVPMK